MKITVIAASCLAICATGAWADITVTPAQDLAEGRYSAQVISIADAVKPRMERPEPVSYDYEGEEGTFTVPVNAEGPAVTIITTPEKERFNVFMLPGEEISITIDGEAPLKYTATGSALMEAVSTLDSKGAVIATRYQNISRAENPDLKVLENLGKEYEGIFTAYLTSNPDSPAAAYAVMQLEGQTMLDAYTALTQEARKSPVMPLLDQRKEKVEKNLEAEKRKASLASGMADAPDFTFKDAAGKEVSLSDFRGKWVVIDFWGTWCPWCIKGFPALKKAYEEYSPGLVVLGVACNDKYDKWLAGLEKYELPWVNVYNPVPGGGKLLEDYAVEGFPTKAIVSPEGKIVNITTGEDPSFFTVLAGFMKK